MLIDTKTFSKSLFSFQLVLHKKSPPINISKIIPNKPKCFFYKLKYFDIEKNPTHLNI